MNKFLFGILGLLFAVPAVADTLPAGYTELEYIQSTGTQYIDTGIIPNGSTKVEMVAQANYSSDLRFFGAVAGSETPLYFAAGYSVSGKWNNMYNSTNNVVSNDVTGFLADKLEHKIVKDNVLSVDGNVLNTISVASFELPVSMYLFTVNDNENPGVLRPMLIKYAKIWNNNTLVRDFVPAKNSSGVIGMYDTVSGNFFTNAGSGTFIAGPVVVLNPCRNLFDISQTATKEFVTTDRIWTRYNIDVSSVSLSAGTWSSKHTDFISPGTYTITVNGTANGIDNIAIRGYDGSNISVLRRGNGTFTITKPTQIWIFTASPEVIAGITEIMLEQGDTATAYVPYCAPDIKIATTAYNTARFSPVVTELNDTIATIRDVVTNTINQTAAIADLQATKQTRPNETCPAGKKCLLVEDDAGQPHWYEIIESAD